MSVVRGCEQIRGVIAHLRNGQGGETGFTHCMMKYSILIDSSEFISSCIISWGLRKKKYLEELDLEIFVIYTNICCYVLICLKLKNKVKKELRFCKRKKFNIFNLRKFCNEAF